MTAQLVHPAAHASTHLVPGLKAWLASSIEQLARIGLDDVKSTTLQQLSWPAIQKWYTSTDPLHSALTACTSLSLLTFILGELTNNASIVDRVWTFLPLIYSAHFTFHDRWSGGKSVSNLFGSGSNSFFKGNNNDPVTFWSKVVPNGVNDRMFLVFVLQVLWSIRLSYNTLRRGFFDFKTEDYRWPIIRSRLNRWQWVFFDLTIVAIFQNVLLAATALPQFLLLTTTRAYHPANPPVPLGWVDFAIAGIFITNLIVEQIADSQQQRFQNWKHGSGLKDGKGGRMLKGYSPEEITKSEGDLRRGFLTRGLWAWSRHPNFICEQLNFYILSLFTVRATVPDAVFAKIWSAARTSMDLKSHIYLVDALRAFAPQIFNYSWLAAIGMSSVLVGSTVLLTEPISGGKYPKYKEYQRRVGMFFPSTTVAKIVWLGVTGQLAAVNEQVFGSGKSKKQ